MIDQLIDKQDSFEIVRDQIAGILVSEIMNQYALAEAAGKDPDDWDFNVYTERSNPWDQFADTERTKQAPIVNVWYDTSGFDQKASNARFRQKADGIFNIDCYGLGWSKDNPDGGHFPGDQLAAFEVQRVVRLVRNILMHSDYTYLGLQGLVWSRWINTISVFQPPYDNRNALHIQGARVVLAVSFNETTSIPESPGTLDYIAIDIHRASDGLVTVEADYDFS